MKKLSIVVGMLNQRELTMTALRMMTENLERPEETEIVVIDNASDPPFGLPSEEDQALYKTTGGARCVRNSGNVGNYPMFFQGLAETTGELIAFIHTDVFIYQKGWDMAVRSQFEAHADLGLVGFIGSTEIDNWGGRGGGTVSNMQGRRIQHPIIQDHAWRGSPAAVHGAVSGGMTIDGSVVDGCVMIFRRTVFEQIPFRENFPPHHHYDRLFSCEVIERGFKVGILGIEFDHISGQSSNTQQAWQTTSAAWFKLHLGIDTPQQWAEVRADWVKRGRNNPSAGKVPDQYDYVSYLEAEYLFLKEYRDEKHLVPLRFGKRI